MPNFFEGYGDDNYWTLEVPKGSGRTVRADIRDKATVEDHLVDITIGGVLFDGTTNSRQASPHNNAIYFRRLVRGTGGAPDVYHHYFGKVVREERIVGGMRTFVEGCVYYTNANGEPTDASGTLLAAGVALTDDDWVATRPPMR